MRIEGGGFEGRRIEGDLDLERKHHIEAISRLLAKIIESGPELDSLFVAAKRQQLKNHLAALGLDRLDHVAFSAIVQELDRKLIEIPTPPDYPDIETFRQNLAEVVNPKAAPRALIEVPQYPKAIQVAEYAQSEWQAIKGRGEMETDRYLYELGKVMSNQSVYTTLFGESDPIAVGEGWQIENGRHRALTLKALGPLYVAQSGMDRWVEVQKAGQI